MIFVLGYVATWLAFGLVPNKQEPVKVKRG